MIAEPDTELLIDRYLEGRTNALEQGDLGRRIASDPAAAAAFVRASRMHAALQQHFDEAHERGRARVEIGALLARQEKRARRAARIAAIGATWGRWRERATAAGSAPWARPAAALAVVLVVAVALAAYNSSEPPAAPAGQPVTLRTSPGPGGPGNDLGAWDTAIPPVLGRDVKRALGRFYLPVVEISDLPIEDAIALLANDLQNVANRHADPTATRIALRVGQQLPDGDPRRAHPVSLRSGSITAAKALQLLAGQAGLSVAYIDGAAELRPRLAADAPLRTRSYQVPEDFLERAASIVPGDATPSNALAMLAYQAPAGATAQLHANGGGTATLAVRANSGDLRSISALAAMMTDGIATQVQLASKVIDLSPDALVMLASSASGGDLDAVLNAIIDPDPADRIITDRADYQSLVALIIGIKGTDLMSMPTVLADIDQEVQFSTASPQLGNTIDLHVLGRLAQEGYDSDETPAALANRIASLFGLADAAGDVPAETPVQWDVSQWIDNMVEVEIDNAVLPIVSTVMPPPPDEEVEVIHEFEETGTFLETAEVAVIKRFTIDDLNGDGDGDLFVAPALSDAPNYSSHLIARLEGESVRVSGSLRFQSETLLAENTPTTWSSRPSHDVPGWGFTPHFHLPAPATDEIDFDATIAEGQTLLLEIDREDGGKKLVFLTAEKR